MQEIPSKKDIGQRLKKLRLEHDLSQAEFASILGLSRSNYSQIELGNQFPTYDVLIGLSKNYNKSYEWILHGSDMSSIISGTTALYSKTEHLNSNSDSTLEDLPVIPQTVTNSSGADQIVLIENPQRKKYSDSYRDSDYLKALPVISIPVNEFSEGYFRAFEVEGDNMKSTLLHNDIVISKFVQDINEVDLSKIFIIVIKDNILIRRIASYVKDSGILICSTDNRKFKPLAIPVQDIKELWEVTAKFSTTITRVIEDIGYQLGEFDSTLLELKMEIQRLKTQSLEGAVAQISK